MNRLEIEQIDGVPIAHLNEDLDAANAAAVQRGLADALDPGALSLVVDLTSSRYVDSAGIDILLRLGHRLDQRRAELVLVVPDSSRLKRLFALVGLPEAIVTYSSVDDALAGPRPGGRSARKGG